MEGFETEVPVCDLCGDAGQRRLFGVRDRRHGVAGEFDLVECTGCGLRYVSPRPVASAIQAWYPDTYPAHVGRRSEAINKVFAFFDGIWDRYQARFLADSYPIFHFSRDVAKYGRPGQAPRILDVGCGSGQKLAYIRRAGWETHGVDFSPRAVESARANGAGDIHLTTGDRLPFPDAHFDAVMSWHSLEHHYSPSATMAEVRRVLKPGGKGIFAVPSGDSVGLRIFKTHWGPLEAPRHLYHFTEATFRQLVQKAGLEVREVHHDFSFYGLFLDQELLESLEFAARDRGIPLRLPRIRGLSIAARIPVLPLNEPLGRLWRGSNLILHFTKPPAG